jgi:hypothetical protein
MSGDWLDWFSIAVGFFVLFLSIAALVINRVMR